MRGASAGGQPVVLTSTFPASNAFTAVAPSVMITSFTCDSLTLFAPHHFLFLTSVRSASWFHDVSLNAPSVTMFFGSVQWLPYFVTAPRFTGRNDVCDSCCTNHACGAFRWMTSVYLTFVETPTFD